MSIVSYQIGVWNIKTSTKKSFKPNYQISKVKYTEKKYRKVSGKYFIQLINFCDKNNSNSDGAISETLTLFTTIHRNKLEKYCWLKP